MSKVVVWIFVAIWFFQLAVGAGAGYASYRLWSERKNEFVKVVMIHLHTSMLTALAAIVLLFLSKGVVFTWKFSSGLFAFMLLWSLTPLPLILFVLRGPKGSE